MFLGHEENFAIMLKFTLFTCGANITAIAEKILMLFFGRSVLQLHLKSGENKSLECKGKECWYWHKELLWNERSLLGRVIINFEFLVRHSTHSVVLLTYQFSKIDFLIPFTQLLLWTDKIWAQFYKTKCFKKSYIYIYI